jgi:hypothetical protein
MNDSWSDSSEETCSTIEEDKARQHTKKNGFAFQAVLTPTLDPLLLLPPVLSTNKQSDLKGPKLEVFGSRVFTQIRPVWVSDLGTMPKN